MPQTGGACLRAGDRRSRQGRRRAWSSASRRAIGTAKRCIEPTDVPDGFWQGLREGEIGLSEIAASRLGVAAGDTVELPTVEGPKQLPGGRNLSSADGQ